LKVKRASSTASRAEQLREAKVAVSDDRFPEGAGWQGLPGWLPQDRAVWNGSATWSVPASALR
jgi:hypothetical protein